MPTTPTPTRCRVLHSRMSRDHVHALLFLLHRLWLPFPLPPLEPHGELPPGNGSGVPKRRYVARRWAEVVNGRLLKVMGRGAVLARKSERRINKCCRLVIQTNGIDLLVSLD
jgi:hypothetical protein